MLLKKYTADIIYFKLLHVQNQYCSASNKLLSPYNFIWLLTANINSYSWAIQQEVFLLYYFPFGSARQEVQWMCAHEREWHNTSLGYHKLILYVFFLTVLSCSHRFKCGTVSNEFNPQASLIAQSFEWKVQPKFSRHRSIRNSSFAVCSHRPQDGG